MGVYNPKMKIPDSCWACPFCTVECFGSYKCFDVKDWGNSEERAKDCPLVEIKEPHGDLVDRNTLMKKANVVYSYDGSGMEYEYKAVSDLSISAAPVVLEAEGNDGSV